MCLPALQCRKAGSAALRLSKQNLPALRGEVRRAGFQPEIRCGSSGKENVPPWWLSWHPVKQGSCTRLPCPGRWRWGEDHTRTQMLSPDTDLHLIMGVGEIVVDPGRPGCSSPRKDGVNVYVWGATMSFWLEKSLCPRTTCLGLQASSFGTPLEVVKVLSAVRGGIRLQMVAS